MNDVEKLVNLLSELNKFSNKRARYFLLTDDGGNINLVQIFDNNIEQTQPIGNVSDLDFAYGKLYKIWQNIVDLNNKSQKNKKALFGDEE